MLTTKTRRLSLIEAVGSMRARDWVRAGATTVIAWLVIGIPSDIVPNPVFGRPIPVRAIDHVILISSALLTGLIFGLRPDAGGVPEDEDRPLLAGGLVAFFAVGCPVCNRLVVGLIGTSGALSWFRPLQPVLGMAAIALLLVALRKRLRDLANPACEVSETSR